MQNRKMTLKEFQDQIQAKKDVQEALITYIEDGESEHVKGLIENVEPTVDVNLADTYSGKTPLMEAVTHSSVVEILLNAKADVNAKDKKGMSALGYAAAHNIASAKTLIEAKADLDSINADGVAPLFMALTESNSAIVKLLVDAKANVEIEKDLAPLHLAAFTDDNTSLKILLEAKANIEVRSADGETPLFIAAEKSRLKALQTLLEAKADVNVTNNSGEALRDVTTNENCIKLLKSASPGFFKPAEVHDKPAAKLWDQQRLKWF